MPTLFCCATYPAGVPKFLLTFPLEYTHAYMLHAQLNLYAFETRTRKHVRRRSILELWHDIDPTYDLKTEIIKAHSKRLLECLHKLPSASRYGY